ncbi:MULTISPECIES: universal stress protein [Rhizobium]|uniref:universal stress protein n=1 Tax=Rhizobium TaxID=379 RepID=UPI0030022644
MSLRDQTFGRPAVDRDSCFYTRPSGQPVAAHRRHRKGDAADLAVIASRRDDVLDRVFASVVDHVVQRAPCSVLVLRTIR